MQLFNKHWDVGVTGSTSDCGSEGVGFEFLTPHVYGVLLKWSRGLIANQLALNGDAGSNPAYSVKIFLFFCKKNRSNVLNLS